MVCGVCGGGFETGKRLSDHIKKAHSLRGEEYTIQCCYGGVRPTCVSCGAMTRYTSFSFREHCVGCKDVAAASGGRRGGKAPAWNRGKTKETDDRIQQQAAMFTGTGNPFFGRRHSQTSIERIRVGKRITPQQLSERITSRPGLTSDVNYSEYTSRQRQYLPFRCDVCGVTSEKTLQAFERGSLCGRCHPNSSSQAELEIGDFIQALGFEVSRNNRRVISPKEIDVLVAERSFGLEYEGLFWHSEAGGKTPSAHLHKTRECERMGIALLRVYADQWRTKRPIVESMVRHRLGLSKHRIHGRQCTVAEVSGKTAARFMDRSHMYGSTAAGKAFGLTHDGALVAVVTLRVPRQRRHREMGLVEIARFASAPNTVVLGGFQKLLPHAVEWARGREFSGMISYADLDTGTGGVYLKAGFELMGETGPSYWYTNGVDRLDRFKYRAKQGRSEREVAGESGVYRIYGAGSRIFTRKF